MSRILSRLFPRPGLPANCLYCLSTLSPQPDWSNLTTILPNDSVKLLDGEVKAGCPHRAPVGPEGQKENLSWNCTRRPGVSVEVARPKPTASSWRTGMPKFA